MPIGKDAFYAELVLAKCKVAPIMLQLSILKAELCALVITVKLFKYLKDHLTIHSNISEAVFW